MAVGLIALVWLALRFTRLGLVVRAVGDDSAAAALRGVAVGRARAFALAFGGAAAGLGRAAITLGFLGYFSEGATARRGYVTLVALILTARAATARRELGREWDA
jgi:general nucleoside transport system permease protein